MKDFQGTEIHVGDTVLYAQQYNSTVILILGEVTDIAPVRHHMTLTLVDNKGGKHNARAAWRLFKVPAQRAEKKG